ncbi:glutathione S-transferase N-terminal domain-containing protein [Candidatus Uhrbacteria bacterium]|nr:glutathione S-transferase N-terminal domain-containing protein [Candidatus Uhrbacteria bacterium]
MHIIFYTKSGCPWCDEVRTLLESKGVAFEERECRNSKENYNELVKKSGQTLTPTLDIDGEIIADTDVSAVAEYFQKKGISGF